MKKVLNIVTSPMGPYSFSNNLANALIAKICDAHPGSMVKVRDLNENPSPHLEESHLQSFFTPPDLHSEDHKEAIQHSNEAIDEIVEADIIVIGVPMYNFSIPSTLKAWIDHIIRRGVTFRMTETGESIGMVNGKKVYLCISTGGIYSEGPMKMFDYTEPYLRTILSFTGMTDITTYRVEGSAIPGIKEVALDVAISKIDIAA